MSLNEFILAFHPEWAMRVAKARRAQEKQRLETATFIEWSPTIKWMPELNIIGASFKPTLLWDTKPALPQPNSMKPGEFIDSPTGQFRYINSKLSKGNVLRTWYGSKLGTVMFNDDIVTPVLFEKDRWSSHQYRTEPWMGVTPAEIISLRGGIRIAKGRVVIAGLGLGYQLIEVSKKKQVNEIVLIEISQELVDWLLPVISPLIHKPLEVMVGDAEKIIPTLTADVALIDIFDSYGNNKYEVDRIRYESKKIPKVWGWGTATIN